MFIVAGDGTLVRNLCENVAGLFHSRTRTHFLNDAADVRGGIFRVVEDDYDESFFA